MRDASLIETAAKRLLGQVANESRLMLNTPLPTPRQVALVLHALADHTALEQARTYSRDYPRGSGTDDDAWPTSLSHGRWLHDVGTYLEIAAALDEKRTP